MAQNTIKASEISDILLDQLRGIDNSLQYEEVGHVLTVSDGVARIYGLAGAEAGELLEFDSGVKGVVMNLEEDNVGAVLLGPTDQVGEGMNVRRMGRIAGIPVGEGLVGRVVDPIGTPLDGLGPVEGETVRMPLERKAPGVIFREPVTEPLQTGLKAIDAMIPIGRGQRELIIGDRQTGKTAIALDAIINQKGKGVKCVYVAIGQKNSSVAVLVEKLRQLDCLDYVTVVSSAASEAAPLQYIAPFAGMAMAEEWMEQGQDVLIVFDDLSKHAVSYRTLSLLLKRSPGREAFPGDIFYLHSRLLERACRLSKEYGGGSITALPIVETQAGDISAYIPTNVISITDGQIFLVTDYFAEGQRPAVDSGFSVSRVGSSAQIKAMKQVAGSLKIELASYREMLSFSQFGSDLDASTKKILAHGAVLMETLKQKQYHPYPMEMQILELFAVKNRYLDELSKEEVGPWLSGLDSFVSAHHADVLQELLKKKAFDDELTAHMKAAVEDYIASRK